MRCASFYDYLSSPGDVSVNAAVAHANFHSLANIGSALRHVSTAARPRHHYSRTSNEKQSAPANYIQRDLGEDRGVMHKQTRNVL